MSIFIAALHFNSIFFLPSDKLFPGLDIARLAVRNEAICAKLITAECFQQILENLQSVPANQLMTIRLLANMLSHEWGRSIVESKCNNIVHLLNKITKGTNNLQV